MATVPVKVGDAFDLCYPFAHDTYGEHWDDDEGPHYEAVPTWKPGTRHADKGEGDVECIADGFGRMLLTVVSVHKPGRFPTRVFFTRTWVTPEGKPFGKTKCRMTTAHAFVRLTRGYQHAFVLHGCKCEGCRWPHHDHRYGEERRSESPQPVDAVDPIAADPGKLTTREKENQHPETRTEGQS